MPKTNKWIQNVKTKPGALHRQLGISPSKTIPKKTLQAVVKAEMGTKNHGVTITPLLKKRANFALNVRRKK